jgi:hypothetical protein
MENLKLQLTQCHGDSIYFYYYSILLNMLNASSAVGRSDASKLSRRITRPWNGCLLGALGTRSYDNNKLILYKPKKRKCTSNDLISFFSLVLHDSHYKFFFC